MTQCMQFAILLSFWCFLIQMCWSSSSDELGVESLSLITTFDVSWQPEPAVYDSKNNVYWLGQIFSDSIISLDADTLEFNENDLLTSPDLIIPLSMVVIPEQDILYVNSAATSQIIGFSLDNKIQTISYDIPFDATKGQHIPNGLCYDPILNFLCYTDYGINFFAPGAPASKNGIIECLDLSTDEFITILDNNGLSDTRPNGCDIKNSLLYTGARDETLNTTVIIVCNLNTLECFRDSKWLDYTSNLQVIDREKFNKYNVGESVQFIDDCTAVIGTFTTRNGNVNRSETRREGVITSYTLSSCADSSSDSSSGPSSDRSDSNEENMVFSTGEYNILADGITVGDLGYDFDRDIIIVPEHTLNDIVLLQINRND